MLILLNIPMFFRKIFAQKVIFFIFFILLASCTSIPQSETWKIQYGYLDQPSPSNNDITETEYYIVFLVAACHLDYLDNSQLVSSLIRYGTRKGNIGHSWILLKGTSNGHAYFLEGGQSGQLGKRQPRFYEGINNYIKYGYANPTLEQKKDPRKEPNPIKYLWEELDDGFFQDGSGGHKATYAAKIDLTETQFKNIMEFISPETYPYGTFSLVGNNCSSFVARVAAMAGLNLEHLVTVKIDPLIAVDGKEYRLWVDPYYSKITFSSPDVIERSLMNAVSNGEAEYALKWYLNR